MNFRELGLNEDFAKRLEAKGIREPSPIQVEVFPHIVEGASVLGFSKTGTGKTLAYLSPLVQRITKLGEMASESPPSSTAIPDRIGFKVVILVPTRELATQVSRDFDVLTESPASRVVIVGGESEDDQLRSSRAAKWAIATPGRFLDLLRRGLVDVRQATTVVFDEADRLLDMGFVDDMRSILKFFPKDKIQLLFFSATIHFGVDEMAYEFGAADILRFGKDQDELTVEGLDHRIAFVGDDEKFHALVHFVASHGIERGIIFSNYRDRAHEVAQRLKGLGCEAEVLTAQLAQPVRSKIMERFRDGRTRILVASDLAARGLDIFDIDFVINYDLPEDPATYVHRVGRTARAGRQGMALSFVGFEDSFRLDKLEKFLSSPIARFQFPTEQLQGRLPSFPRAAKAPAPHDSHQQAHKERTAAPARQQTSPLQSSQPRAAVKDSAKPSPVLATNHISTGGLWHNVTQFFKKLFGTKVSVPKTAPKSSSKASHVADHRSENGASSGSRSHRPRSGGGASGRGSGGGGGSGNRSRGGGRGRRPGGASVGRRPSGGPGSSRS